MVKCTPLLALTVIVSAGSDALSDPTVKRLAKLATINQAPATQSNSDSKRVLRASDVPNEVAAGESRSPKSLWPWEVEDKLAPLKEKLISTSADDLEAGGSAKKNALPMTWRWLWQNQIETKKTPIDEISKEVQTAMDLISSKATHGELNKAGVSVSDYVKALKLTLPEVDVDVVNRGMEYNIHLGNK